MYDVYMNKINVRSNFGVFFIIIVASFYITFNTAHADLPCGTIVHAYGAPKVIEDCEDPFGVREAPGVSSAVYIDSEEISEGDVVSVAPGGTRNFYSTYVTQLDDIQIVIYKHEGDDYVEVNLYELVQPTPEELLVFAEEFFGEGIDLSVYLDAYPERNDNFTNEEEDLFFDFLDYVEARLLIPSLQAGVYTWVTRDFCLTLSQNTILEKLKHMIVPVAYAAGCNNVPLDGYVYALTFELVEGDVVEPEPEIDPLLLQYAPILYMHEDEDYFPMNVESFVEGSALWSQDGIGDTLLQSEENLTFEEFESVVQNDDTSNYYLAYSDPANGGTINLAEAKAKYNRATSSGEATTTVYVYKMLDGYTDEQGNDHEFIVLQYWYFYAMNNWLEQGGRNNHEGDWESVFIFLDAETEEAMHVAYSAHHNDGDSSDDILQVESVRREWEDNEVLKNGDMVKSFVSLGSHAMYPSVGTVNVLGKNDISSVDGQKLEINNSSEVHSVSTTGPVWMNYGGKWGTDKVDILDSQSGPLGPNYTNVSGHLRFHEPVKWAGIDQSSEFIISEPTTAITSTVAQVTMQFTDALQEGTVVTIDPHKEYISFGTTITDTTFLPRYYDFDTSMLNGTFEVEVTLAYTDEELLALELDEDDLSIFYYNAVTDSWEEVDATVDSVENTISFTTDHFSRYAIGVPEEVEYSVEELFDLFRHEVGETDLRSYQKRFLKRYSKFVERFIARDTDKAIRVAKRLLARLERKLEKFEKWSVLSQEERDAFSELLGKIQEKI